MSHLHFAVRSVLRQPGFTAVAVVTLALGIGACTTMFSVIRHVMLKPLPVGVRRPGRFVDSRAPRRDRRPVGRAAIRVNLPAAFEQSITNSSCSLTFL
jgi:hypothetical protein